jgi:Ca2+-binding EF-hand superfamily protein
MNKLAFSTLVAMGMTAAALAQQPSQQTTPRSSQPQTQQTQPRQQQPGSSQSTPAPRGGDRTEQMSFERADKDGDGKVSRTEGNAIEGFDFSRADTNNDASLNRQEFQAAMATSTPGHGPGQNSEPDRGGANARNSQSPQRDQSAGGSQRRDESGAGAGQPRVDQGQRSAQVSFDTADTNKDGKISREEGTSVPGLNFTSADVNADSSLSRQEFQTAMAGVQPRG